MIYAGDACIDEPSQVVCFSWCSKDIRCFERRSKAVIGLDAELHMNLWVTYPLHKSIASSRLVMRQTMITRPAILRPKGAFVLQ